MTLTLRPTGLQTPAAFTHLADWTVHADGGEQAIGRIYQQPAPPSPEQAWFWALQIIGAHQAGVATSGRAPSLDAAKAEFLRSLEAYKAWAGR